MTKNTFLSQSSDSQEFVKDVESKLAACFKNQNKGHNSWNKQKTKQKDIEEQHENHYVHLINN